MFLYCWFITRYAPTVDWYMLTGMPPLICIILSWYLNLVVGYLYSFCSLKNVFKSMICSKYTVNKHNTMKCDI